LFWSRRFEVLGQDPRAVVDPALTSQNQIAFSSNDEKCAATDIAAKFQSF